MLNKSLPHRSSNDLPAPPSPVHQDSDEASREAEEPGAVENRFRRVLRAEPDGKQPNEMSIYTMASKAGFYKKNKQATYLFGNDRKTVVGAQIADGENQGFASFHFKESTVYIHGKKKEKVLAILEPHTEVNMAPPRRKKKKKAATAREGARPPAPPGRA